MDEGKLSELFKALKPSDFDFDKEGRVVLKNDALMRQLVGEGIISAGSSTPEDVINQSNCTVNQSSCGGSITDISHLPKPPA